jgi:DNA-binding CsgD family transcriptional regulator
VLAELQKLLQADGMHTLMTDRAGNVIEQSQQSAVHFLLLEKRLWLFPIELWLKKIDRLGRAITFELELPGLFVSVVPIKTNHQACYLWVMGGLNAKIKEQLLAYAADHDEYPHQWTATLQALPTTEGPGREKIQFKLELIAQLAATLFDSRIGGTLSLKQNEAILKAAECLKRGSLEPVSVLNELIEDAPASFFCGYAEAADPDTFCIVDMLRADHKRMAGASFQLGEGFLGQAGMIGEVVSWQQIETDPRSQYFHRYDIRPQNLHCVPIRKNDGSVKGLVFFGSEQASHELPELVTPVKIVAELYGFQHSLEDLERAYQKQKTYLSSLIEIAKLVTVIREIKSLLTVFVDIGINLVEDGRSSLFMFLLPGKSKANIVSRGITQEQAQLYCKDLTSRYFGLSSRLNEPHTANAPWGETALECPISVRSEVRGVICVFLPKAERVDEYMNIFQAFMTLANITIERAVQQFAENETKRRITLLYESVGEFSKELQQFHAKARLLASEFAESVSMSSDEVSLISSVCLISPFSTEFIKKHFADERELIMLLSGYRECVQGAVPGDQQDHGKAAEVLALVYSYLNGGENLSAVDRLERISSPTRELFKQFVNKRQALSFETPIDKEQTHTADSKGPDLQELFQQFHLSNREQEVYKLVVNGLSNRDIAEALYISEHTVKNHITNLFQKLGVNDRAQAIALAYRSSWS